MASSHSYSMKNGIIAKYLIRQALGFHQPGQVSRSKNRPSWNKLVLPSLTDAWRFGYETVKLLSTREIVSLDFWLTHLVQWPMVRMRIKIVREPRIREVEIYQRETFSRSPKIREADFEKSRSDIYCIHI